MNFRLVKVFPSHVFEFDQLIPVFITGPNEVVAKVIFLHLFVILFTGGVVSQKALRQTPPDQTPPPPEQTPAPRTRPPLDQTPPDQPPREQTPPRKQTPAYGLRAAGTHPTGMHSCY